MSFAWSKRTPERKKIQSALKINRKRFYNLLSFKTKMTDLETETLNNLIQNKVCQ